MNKLIILSFLLFLSSCCTEEENDTFEFELINPPKLPNNIGSQNGERMELDR